MRKLSFIEFEKMNHLAFKSDFWVLSEGMKHSKEYFDMDIKNHIRFVQSKTMIENISLEIRL